MDIRLAVFRAVVENRWDVRAVAEEIGCTQAEVRSASVEMEGVGLPLTGAFAFVSPAQAGWVLGVIERRVRGFCGEGRLGTRVGGRYVITAQDLVRFASIPRPMGGAGVKELAKHRRKTGAKRR